MQDKTDPDDRPPSERTANARPCRPSPPGSSLTIPASCWPPPGIRRRCSQNPHCAQSHLRHRHAQTGVCCAVASGVATPTTSATHVACLENQDMDAWITLRAMTAEHADIFMATSFANAICCARPPDRSARFPYSPGRRVRSLSRAEAVMLPLHHCQTISGKSKGLKRGQAASAYHAGSSDSSPAARPASNGCRPWSSMSG